ncbi:MAG: thioredoxin domain-containing protein [Ktedonobacterales bacterium]|nr:thioredoxin domain-containing protein [Ktedonobacterales bacterium]
MGEESPGEESSAPIPQQTNRLIHETSPYLLQHAHNPVEWYPWGPEAFERAQALDRPLLLSVGYSSCHWCHVMAHESFENAETAALMNALFINIKVDREERPDIDALYMDAVQALNGGNGGWPMTVFLTPDAAPFAGGTYFPPVRRHGMPAFAEVLRGVAEAYGTQRGEVERQAQAFRDFYRARGEAPLAASGGSLPTATEVDPRELLHAAERHLASFDPVNGGLMRAPKFPHPMNLAFLLRVLAREGVARGAAPAPGSVSARVLPLVRLTLEKMAGGGIYDQVGGGFHRYATDAIWLVPHFEKMLYDNALLAPVYIAAWQLTGEAGYRRVCEEILDYVLREMTDPGGGFYSTQDADSEGEEGRFYLWSAAEMRDALGAEDMAILERIWGVSAGGNFEGRNIPHLAEPVERVAAALGLSEERVREAVARARERLYAVRARRVWPGRDDKVLAAWNGLMQRAMAEAGRILDREDYRQAAVANAVFLRERMLVDGRLRRSWRQGQARLDAYLEDYAALVNGLLSTYEATGEASFFGDARARAEEMLARFWDEAAGAFFDTAADHERLIGRPRELADGATPSGMSLATEALVRLAAFTGEGRYRDVAARILVPLVPAMAQQPLAFGHLLCALDDFVGPFYEVALIGAPEHAATGALRRAINSRYLPRLALAQAAPDDARAATVVPLLAGRSLLAGQPAAYVCQGFVCRLPVTQPEALVRELEG